MGQLVTSNAQMKWKQKENRTHPTVVPFLITVVSKLYQSYDAVMTLEWALPDANVASHFRTRTAVARHAEGGCADLVFKCIIAELVLPSYPILLPYIGVASR